MLDERWPNAVRSALKRTVRDDYRLVYIDKRSGDAAVYVRNPEPGSARSLPP
jgi:hypothetical protein